MQDNLQASYRESSANRTVDRSSRNAVKKSSTNAMCVEMFPFLVSFSGCTGQLAIGRNLERAKFCSGSYPERYFVVNPVSNSDDAIAPKIRRAPFCCVAELAAGAF